MSGSSCLLKGILRRQKGFHNTISESEEVCHLRGSWNIGVWSIVMCVNIFQVTWRVAIRWDQQKVGHRKNKFCLKLELVFSCQGSLMFLCCHFSFKFWVHQVLYSLVIQVLFLLFQSWWWPCFWSSFSWGFHCKMLWKKIFSCFGHIVLMKYFYCLLGYELTRFGDSDQNLHKTFHLVKQ